MAYEFTFHFPVGVPRELRVYLASDTPAVLDAVQALTVTVNRIESQMALDTSALLAAVAAVETVGGSVIELLDRITAQLDELIAQSGNTVDPAEIQSIVDRLNAERDAIAAAVEEHTPPPADVGTSVTGNLDN